MRKKIENSKISLDISAVQEARLIFFWVKINPGSCTVLLKLCVQVLQQIIFFGQDSVILSCCQKINGLKKKHWQSIFLEIKIYILYALN